MQSRIYEGLLIAVLAFFAIQVVLPRRGQARLGDDPSRLHMDGPESGPSGDSDIEVFVEEEEESIMNESEAEFDLEVLEHACKTAGDYVPPDCQPGHLELARQRAADARRKRLMDESAGVAKPTRKRYRMHRRRKTDPPKEVDVKELHSSHTCYGRDFLDQNWKRTTCLYHDLCYHDRKFYYIVRNQFERKHVQDAEMHDGQNHLAVSLAPLGEERGEDQMFVPEIISQEAFSGLVHGRTVKYLSNIHILYVSYNAENFGHFLSDELFPAYSMLEAFDELDYNVQLMRVELEKPIQWSCDFQRQNWGELQWEKCMYRYKTLTSLFTRNPIETVTNYTKRVGDPVCFRKVAAGMGMLADHCEDGIGHGRMSNRRHDCNQGRQVTLWNYRNYVMGNIGIPPNALPEKNRVILWDRHVTDYKPERKIFGLPELAKRIEVELEIEAMRFETWHAKPVKYQIQQMAISTIFITGPGSGSFISWFLPRGSTQIRLYPVWSKMEWFIFNYMPHMHVEHLDAKGGKFNEDKLMELVQMGLRRFDAYKESHVH
mmetsp:Transcript_7197/g.17511  ORF Transcript_7197/g.17511 Transcript_7197/m.17511 type:complete len:544 (+) Transcript_7197:26-1657(+)